MKLILSSSVNLLCFILLKFSYGGGLFSKIERLQEVENSQSPSLSLKSLNNIIHYAYLLFSSCFLFICGVFSLDFAYLTTWPVMTPPAAVTRTWQNRDANLVLDPARTKTRTEWVCLPLRRGLPTACWRSYWVTLTTPPPTWWKPGPAVDSVAGEATPPHLRMSNSLLRWYT